MSNTDKEQNFFHSRVVQLKFLYCTINLAQKRNIHLCRILVSIYCFISVHYEIDYGF